MATKAPPPQFKAVVRSKRGIRMEFSGDIYTGMIQSFFYTDDKEQRESILSELQRIHTELSELEDKARPA